MFIEHLARQKVSRVLIASVALLVTQHPAHGANNQPPASEGSTRVYSEVMLLNAWTQVHQHPVAYQAGETEYDLCIAKNGIYSPWSGFFVKWKLEKAWYVPYRPRFDQGQYKLGSIAYLFRITQRIPGYDEVGGITSNIVSPVILEYNLIDPLWYKGNNKIRLEKLEHLIDNTYKIKNKKRQLIEFSIFLGKVWIKTLSKKTLFILENNNFGILTQKSLQTYLREFTFSSASSLSASTPKNRGCFGLGFNN